MEFIKFPLLSLKVLMSREKSLGSNLSCPPSPLHSQSWSTSLSFVWENHLRLYFPAVGWRGPMACFGVPHRTGEWPRHAQQICPRGALACVSSLLLLSPPHGWPCSCRLYVSVSLVRDDLGPRAERQRKDTADSGSVTLGHWLSFNQSRVSAFVLRSQD